MLTLRSVLPTPAVLADVVRHFYIASAGPDPLGGAIRYARLAEAEAHLVFIVDEFASDGAVASARLCVTGSHLGLTPPLVDDAQLVIAASLMPGAVFAAVGVAAHTLLDRIVPLEQVWGARARDLSDRLVATRGDVARVRVLAGSLSAHCRRDPAMALAAGAIAALDRCAGGIRIATLAAQLGVGERRLGRAFASHIGMTPKDYARVARMRTLIDRIDAGPADWTALAMAGGFYDQSHLINEFDAFLGTTPETFRAWLGAGADIVFGALGVPEHSGIVLRTI